MKTLSILISLLLLASCTISSKNDPRMTGDEAEKLCQDGAQVPCYEYATLTEDTEMYGSFGDFSAKVWGSGGLELRNCRTQAGMYLPSGVDVLVKIGDFRCEVVRIIPR